MALIDLDIAVDDDPLPGDVALLVETAERYSAEFQQERADTPILGFVPCDYAAVYPILRAIVEGGYSPGNYFCEWGSGVGGVTCLAAMLELNAFGIEIERDLFELAESLALEFDLPAEYALGSFIPAGAEDMAQTPGEFHWLASGGADGYADLEIAPDEFDIIFAYPWPDEQDVIHNLFDHVAATGSILITFEYLDGIKVFRKAPRRKRRR